MKTIPPNAVVKSAHEEIFLSRTTIQNRHTDKKLHGANFFVSSPLPPTSKIIRKGFYEWKWIKTRVYFLDLGDFSFCQKKK